MANAQEFNAGRLAFRNGAGGNIWAARQAHTDELAPVSEALLAFAAPRLTSARPTKGLMDV